MAPPAAFVGAPAAAAAAAAAAAQLSSAASTVSPYVGMALSLYLDWWLLSTVKLTLCVPAARTVCRRFVLRCVCRSTDPGVPRYSFVCGDALVVIFWLARLVFIVTASLLFSVCSFQAWHGAAYDRTVPGCGCCTPTADSHAPPAGTSTPRVGWIGVTFLRVPRCFCDPPRCHRVLVTNNMMVSSPQVLTSFVHFYVSLLLPLFAVLLLILCITNGVFLSSRAVVRCCLCPASPCRWPSFAGADVVPFGSALG